MRGFPPNLYRKSYGYVMPDEPDKVYQKPDFMFRLFSYIIIFFIWCAGVVIIYSSLLFYKKKDIYEII